jgi:hypothetical protein
MPQSAKRPWPDGEGISTTHEPFTSNLTHYRVRKMNVMLSLNPHMWSTLAVFVMLAPSPAPAQTVANSFEELRQVLKKGQTVVVTDASGQRTKGKVADVSLSSLVILIPEARTFAEGTVTEIKATDPLSNGALIGAGHRDGARDVGLSHRSERAGKRRRLYCGDWSRDRGRRRHRRIGEQGRNACLRVASADTTLDDLTRPRKRSARRAAFRQLLIGGDATPRAFTGRLRLDPILSVAAQL